MLFQLVNVSPNIFCDFDSGRSISMTSTPQITHTQAINSVRYLATATQTFTTLLCSLVLISRRFETLVHTSWYADADIGPFACRHIPTNVLVHGQLLCCSAHGLNVLVNQRSVRDTSVVIGLIKNAIGNIFFIANSTFSSTISRF